MFKLNKYNNKINKLMIYMYLMQIYNNNNNRINNKMIKIN